MNSVEIKHAYLLATNLETQTYWLIKEQEVLSKLKFEFGDVCPK